jgi:type I restriction enzyme S subunit
MTTQKMAKTYKQTELGIIPEDWKSLKFEDVISEFSVGQTPSRSKPDYFKGNILWITSGELNYNIITDTVEKITDAGARSANLRLLPKGTFLFSIIGLEAEGTRGTCAITGIAATANQSTMALFPKEDILTTDYLLHFYVAYGKKLALKYCQGTKQQNYTAGTAKLLPMNIPPTIDEQKAITEILSNCNALIESLEKLIEKKKNIKHGTMQELLTGKRRLFGPWMKKEGVKSTEIGSIPEDWSLLSFGELFKFLSTATNARSDLLDESDFGYVHYGDIHAKWKLFLDCDTDEIPGIFGDKIGNLPLMQDGDLIMVDASEDYDGIGTSVEVKNVKNRKIVSGLHTIFLRGNKEKVVDGYKAYLTSIPVVKNALISKATGISVYSTSKASLKSVQIPLPSDKEEQKAIGQIINDMATDIQVLERKRDKCKLLKVGLMQQLLSGRIRLKW